MKSVLGHFFLGLSKGILTIAVLFGIGALSWFGLVRLVHPDIQAFLHAEAPLSTLLYAKDGQLLYEYWGDYKRQEVLLSNISPNLIHATLTAEDQSFYEHKGFWLPSILRAAILDITYNDTTQGGSTITQQLVKNVILSNNKSFFRKIAEIVWSVEIEKKLSKDEILAKYLNRIPYGRNSAGAEAASQSFFGKSAKDLSPLEAAYLAALPKAPSLLSPDGNGKNALDARAQYILKEMHELGFITNDEYKDAQTQTIHFTEYHDTIKSPHFVFQALKQLKNIIGEKPLTKGGFVVTTTLDSTLQKNAEDDISVHIASIEKKMNAHNAALVAIEPNSGNILAYVGSKDYFGTAEPTNCIPGKTCLFDPQTDIGKSLRQTGSSFKPYVYVTAFGEEFKFTPASKVADIKENHAGYSPNNYSGKTFGYIPARKALAGSLNVAAVNLLAEIGEPAVINTLRKLGVSAPLEHCGLSLALGACEMSLLEHTAAFAGLINLGAYNQPTYIEKIQNSSSDIVYQHTPKPTQAVEEAASYELLDILSDNNARSYIFGKKNPLAFTDRQVVAKTGTTQNWKDGWTMGGSPALAVGLWIGNNNGATLKAGSDAIVSAAPLWRKFIDDALSGKPAEKFKQPFGISRVALDKNGNVKTAKAGQILETQPIADYALNIKMPTIGKPKVAGVKTPEIPTDSSDETSTVILEPWANQTIDHSPFQVSVYTGSSTEETEVKLFLDDKLIAVKSTAPFLFKVDDQLTNGWHTLKATATHFGFLENTYTVRFKTFFNPPQIFPRGK